MIHSVFRTISTAVALLVSFVGVAVAKPELDRTVLPVPDPVYEPITELDARKAKAPPRADVTAPTGAPNVVIVLIDDIGFGTAGSFGGAIETPTLDRLAELATDLRSLWWHGYVPVGRPRRRSGVCWAHRRTVRTVGTRGLAPAQRRRFGSIGPVPALTHVGEVVPCRPIGPVLGCGGSKPREHGPQSAGDRDSPFLG